MTKTETTHKLLAEAGFVKGEKNSIEAKTFKLRTPVHILTKMLEKYLDEGITEEVVKPKAKKVSNENILVKALFNIKHNGTRYIEGDVFEISREGAESLYLADVISFEDKNEEKPFLEKKEAEKAKELEELANLKKIAEGHSAKL